MVWGPTEVCQRTVTIHHALDICMTKPLQSNWPINLITARICQAPRERLSRKRNEERNKCPFEILTRLPLLPYSSSYHSKCTVWRGFFGCYDFYLTELFSYLYCEMLNSSVLLPLISHKVYAEFRICTQI